MSWRYLFSISFREPPHAETDHVENRAKRSLYDSGPFPPPQRLAKCSTYWGHLISSDTEQKGGWLPGTSTKTGPPAFRALARPLKGFQKPLNNTRTKTSQMPSLVLYVNGRHRAGTATRPERRGRSGFPALVPAAPVPTLSGGDGNRTARPGRAAY